jgi:delta-aminolevulinic acid dehydratase/porphobilinogen synthase
MTNHDGAMCIAGASLISTYFAKEAAILLNAK